MSVLWTLTDFTRYSCVSVFDFEQWRLVYCLIFCKIAWKRTLLAFPLVNIIWRALEFGDKGVFPKLGMVFINFNEVARFYHPPSWKENKQNKSKKEERNGMQFSSAIEQINLIEFSKASFGDGSLITLQKVTITIALKCVKLLFFSNEYWPENQSHFHIWIL